MIQADERGRRVPSVSRRDALHRTLAFLDSPLSLPQGGRRSRPCRFMETPPQKSEKREKKGRIRCFQICSQDGSDALMLLSLSP